MKLCRRLAGIWRDRGPAPLLSNNSHCHLRLSNMIARIPIHLPGKPDEGMAYCISHYLGITSYVMLLAGLGLGLYTRWWETGDTDLFVIALIGFFTFSFNVVLCYYFAFQRLSAYLSHLWFGALLGIVTFYQWRTPVKDAASSLRDKTTLKRSEPRRGSASTEGHLIFFDDFTMNILLMVSLLLQANWTLFARGTRRSSAVSVFLKTPEMLEVAGMAVAGMFHRTVS